MLAVDTGMFVRSSEETEQRILHPARIKAAVGASYTAELEDEDVTLEAGREILVYYSRDDEFMQQSARVEAIIDSETTTVFGFEMVGDPVSAESRECYRVSTALTGLLAGLGAESARAVRIDVSATGFSVIAGEEHRVGTTLMCSVPHGEKTYSGVACVQSIKELDLGRIRYGLRCVDKDGGDLSKGLHDISMSVQRTQLRRLSKNA